VVVTRPELGGGENVEIVRVGKDAFGNDFFQELTAALKEADRAIGLGEGIVGLVGFGDHDDNCLFPRVVSKRDRSIEDLKEPVWAGLKSPLQEFVIDPG